MAAANISSGIPLESSSRDVATSDGSSSLVDESSYTLKLFRHQRIVTYASRKDCTFRTPSEPPVYNATIRALNILEVSTVIASYLLPRRHSRSAIEGNPRPETHRDIINFGRACTSLYMSAMRILYQRVFWLPGLWCVLIDKFATLGYPYTDMVVSNPPLLLLVLRLQYDDEAVLRSPESVLAYKFRRFLFITAQYVTALLPNHRKTLFPGLRTASWLDDEYLFPSFLSSSPSDPDSRPSSPSPGDISNKSGGSPRASPSLQSWLPFDTDTIRTLNLQMHTLISPMDRTANHALFLASIEQLGNQCRAFFPRLDRIMFVVCRHKYHKPSVLSRLMVNVVADFVLETGAVPLSAGIPPTPATLPFRKEHILGGHYVEGIAINGYLSHAPAILNAGGETASGATPSDAYPIVSAHLVTAVNVLAMACTTNMTPTSIGEKHVICRILSPAVDARGLETLILHFNGISLRLSHGDLMFIAEKWKNLRTLDLRFKTIVTNKHLDIIQLNSVQYMTRPDYVDRLKRIHLPELDVRHFRNLMKYRQDSLTTLTSSVLHFNEKEIKDVCTSLLAAYPSLTTVVGPGSDPNWSKFSSVLGVLREKRRTERDNRDRWILGDAVLAQIAGRRGI